MAVGEGVIKYVEGGSNAISGVANFLANLMIGIKGRTLLLILVIMFIGWLFFESARQEKKYWKWKRSFR